MKKGETLVEILVAIAVFLIIFAGLVTCLLSLSNLNRRQQAYVYFENICRSIDQYIDVAGESWDIAYWGISNSDASEAEPATVYYDENYAVCQPDEQPRFRLEYHYDSENALIVSVQDIVKGYEVISGLNYGTVSGGQP